MNLTNYQLVLDYVQICTKTLDKNQFSNIVSENVELNHQTNDDDPIIVRGREVVAELFTKYIFSNTTDIEVKKSNLIPSGENIKLILKVTANKKEGEKVNRYIFEETTLFAFNKDEPSQISRIETAVKRIPV